MIVPYSTDAPIYHFPWMTIVLIVANTVCFALTGGGVHNDGWVLTYGRGLHPVEWIAYNFLHLGPWHLVGNMFFLWSFGIVVEGKLGWWKYLFLYLTIGVISGFLIQTAMLWHNPDITVGVVKPRPNEGWLWTENTVHAQDFLKDIEGFDDGNDMEDGPKQPVGKDGRRANRKQDKEDALLVDESEGESPPGGSGASMIIYGLLGVVLIWAPRNELHFFWLFGFRAGVAEIEYTWFCGFYIVVELLTAFFGGSGFDLANEVSHATGALLGLGLGTLFVKQDWVDCENWDLFSVMAGRHSSVARVGEWQNYYSANVSERDRSLDDLDQNSPGVNLREKRKKKRKKLKPKLVELESLDDAFDEFNDDDDVLEAELVENDVKPSSSTSRNPNGGSRSKPYHHASPTSDSKRPVSASKREKLQSQISSETSEFVRDTSQKLVPPPIPLPSKRWFSEPVDQIRQLISEGEFQGAYAELRRVQADDKNFRLPEVELELLSTGLFKARAASEAVPLLEEFIERFKDRADRQRIKLAVLYVKFQCKPTAALKTLAVVNRNELPDDYLAIYRKAASAAQEMISAGVTDSHT